MSDWKTHGKISDSKNIHDKNAYGKGFDIKKSTENAGVRKSRGNTLKAKTKALKTSTTNRSVHLEAKKSHTRNV